MKPLDVRELPRAYRVERYGRIWGEQHSISELEIELKCFAAGLTEEDGGLGKMGHFRRCLLYTSPSPRDGRISRMPSSA